MTDVVIPSPGESITEVTLGNWQRGDGDWVNKDDLLTEIESDKATLELLAPAAGVLKTLAKSRSEQKVGAVVAKIDTNAQKPANAAPAAASAGAAAAGAGAAPVAEAKATSVARKMAAEKGVDLTRVSGTGPSGRVTKEDVERASSPARPAGAPAAAPRSAPAPASPAIVPGSRATRREPIPRIRQRIAERLVDAQRTAAMLTTFNECDMTEVMRLRAEHKEAFEKRHGVGLGLMGFFVKAVASALPRFPKANAFIVGDEFEFHDFCDIAVAVGTDRGLVVPVLRNAESMSFAQIESTLKDLAAKAREGRIAIHEMTGGTFTITNGGVYGSLMSTPILNPPQSAILGMHTIKKRAVEDPANPGHVAIRPMMYLALSYDHRVIDGSEAVSFLVHIKGCIEKPERMLIDP